MLKSRLLLSFFAIAVCASEACGQKVTLHKHGLASFTYSVNNLDLHEIGTADSGLVTVMQSDTLALSQLKKYFSGRRAGQFTALLGFAMASIGGYKTAVDMGDEGIHPLLFVGAGFCVAGGIQIIAASRHLNRSVDAYNKHIDEAGTAPSAAIGISCHERAFGLALSIRF